jgi:LysM repeat protein
MLPFALVVIVFLLLLFRFLDSGSADVFVCAAHSHSYKVEMGDTCWAVAKRHGLEVDGLLKMNPGVECERLGVGRTLCVPN